MDPEELFRKIFGEFSGSRGFGDFNAIFDQPQEVSEVSAKDLKKPVSVCFLHMLDPDVRDANARVCLPLV